jgi:hypothetical protein
MKLIYTRLMNHPTTRRAIRVLYYHIPFVVYFVRTVATFVVCLLEALDRRHDAS